VGNNIATGYTGTKTLIFSGALSSTNPIEPPRVFDQSGTQRNFGVGTPLTFNNGVMSTASNAGHMRLFRTGTGIAINVVDSNIPALDSAPNGTFTVNVNTNNTISVHRLALTLSNTSLTAGVPVSMTITAQDQYGNTRTDYTGNKNVTFSSVPSITAPDGSAATVFARNGTSPVNFGSTTSIAFSAGVATPAVGKNGVLTVYKTGSFTINALETTSDPDVSSNPGGDTGVGYLAVNVSNSPNQTIQMSLTSPQINGAAFTGSNVITLTDAYLNPVVIDAATRPVVLTTSLNGGISLTASGDDNTLNETDDFAAAGQANLTSLGMIYTGVVGTGRITATVASPLGGFISSGASVTIDPGAPKTLTIQGKTGTNAPVSDMTVVAGTPISLQMRAFDVGNNLTTNFTGALALTFNSGGTSATGSIRDSGNTTVTLGTPTSINFAGGVSSVAAGGANGLMVITSSGNYLITAAGDGVTTPLSNALTLQVNLTVTGANDGIVEPEQKNPNKLFLPSAPNNAAAQIDTVVPQQPGGGVLYMPAVPR
jgi:hypothetical protein